MSWTNSAIDGKEPEDVKARQDLFLSLYSELGSIRAAAKEMNISRRTPTRWIKDDIQGFKERFEEAKFNFREMLQDIAVNRVKEQSSKDNPVLLIALLNAHWAEKYRPQTTSVDDTAKEVLSDLRDRFKVIKKVEETEETSDISPQQQVEDILKGKGSKGNDG
tara:strand:+ start:416 stop:904 length:489 start_codon:yes stop_codon:yes gene_type:complete